jgi:ABC-2 type transport system ATP-binding protein
MDVAPGEIYGILGPNGAGKTTLIKMLTGTIPPTAGIIRLFGSEMSPSNLILRKRLGVVPEKHPFGVWNWMTGYDYLKMFGELFEVENLYRKMNTLLERVRLIDAKDKKISQYSRGMLQKLSIIRALLPEPDILFLDEPISGLDPIGIKEIRDLVQEEHDEGRTIFISSHILSEMEKLCSKVAIIYRGKLMAEAGMKQLLGTLVKEKTLEVEFENYSPKLTEMLSSLPYVSKVMQNQNKYTLTLPVEGDYRKSVSQFLFRSGFVPLSIHEKSATLEEAFITITKEDIHMLIESEAANEPTV